MNQVDIIQLGWQIHTEKKLEPQEKQSSTKDESTRFNWKSPIFKID